MNEPRAYLYLLIIALIAVCSIRWWYWRNEWVEIPNSTPMKLGVMYWFSGKTSGGPSYGAKVKNFAYGEDAAATLPGYISRIAVGKLDKPLSATGEFHLYTQRKNLP